MVLRFNRQASGEKPHRFPKASAKVQPYNEYTNLYESFFEKKSMLYMKTLINRRIYQNKQKRGDKSLIKIHINIYNTESMQGQKNRDTEFFLLKRAEFMGQSLKNSVFLYLFSYILRPPYRRRLPTSVSSRALYLYAPHPYPPPQTRNLSIPSSRHFAEYAAVAAI